MSNFLTNAYAHVNLGIENSDPYKYMYYMLTLFNKLGLLSDNNPYFNTYDTKLHVFKQDLAAELEDCYEKLIQFAVLNYNNSVNSDLDTALLAIENLTEEFLYSLIATKELQYLYELLRDNSPSDMNDEEHHYRIQKYNNLSNILETLNIPFNNFIKESLDYLYQEITKTFPEIPQFITSIDYRTYLKIEQLDIPRKLKYYLTEEADTAMIKSILIDHFNFSPNWFSESVTLGRIDKVLSDAFAFLCKHTGAKMTNELGEVLHNSIKIFSSCLPDTDPISVYEMSYDPEAKTRNRTKKLTRYTKEQVEEGLELIASLTNRVLNSQQLYLLDKYFAIEMTTGARHPNTDVYRVPCDDAGCNEDGRTLLNDCILTGTNIPVGFSVTALFHAMFCWYHFVATEDDPNRYLVTVAQAFSKEPRKLSELSRINIYPTSESIMSLAAKIVKRFVPYETVFTNTQAVALIKSNASDFITSSKVLASILIPEEALVRVVGREIINNERLKSFFFLIFGSLCGKDAMAKFFSLGSTLPDDEVDDFIDLLNADALVLKRNDLLDMIEGLIVTDLSPLNKIKELKTALAKRSILKDLVEKARGKYFNLEESILENGKPNASIKYFIAIENGKLSELVTILNNIAKAFLGSTVQDMSAYLQDAIDLNEHTNNKINLGLLKKEVIAQYVDICNDLTRDETDRYDTVQELLKHHVEIEEERISKFKETFKRDPSEVLDIVLKANEADNAIRLSGLDQADVVFDTLIEVLRGANIISSLNPQWIDTVKKTLINKLK